MSDDARITTRRSVRIRRFAQALWVLGILAGAWGVLYAANGATQAHASVKVPVTLTSPGTSGWGNTTLQIDGLAAPGARLAPAAPTGLQTGSSAGADGTVTVAAWDSTVLEQVLGRGDALIGGIALLVGAGLLRPTLLTVAEGRPFAPGNARRVRLLAAVIAAGGVLAPLLPQIAGVLVLERTSLDTTGRFLLMPSIDPGPLVLAAVVLCVAEAFRAGTALADDVDGLV